MKPNKRKSRSESPQIALPINQLLIGDTVEQMQLLPDHSIDMIFADPPYNLQLSQGDLFRPDHSFVDAVRDDWDQFSDFAAYDEFTLAWLKQVKRILKPDGSFWVIGSYHNIFRLGYHMQNLGFWLLNDVIWVKTNPMPNFKGRRFTNAHETMIWATPSSKSKYKFNYEAMKLMNDDRQMRSDWEMPLCGGGERIKNDLGKKAHPTQKPESLLHRIILSCSDVGDSVLDPFSGSGTTAAVAKKLGRNYIAIERDPAYIEVIKTRLENTQAIDDPQAITHTPPKRKEARIAFGTLVERGLLRPGTILHSPCKRHHAKVRIDGSLMTDRYKGSIHQVGALVQGAPTCNGWTYWMMEMDQETMQIDILRQQLRLELQDIALKDLELQDKTFSP
ncbi:MAG: site-specific DNA-methyltransferase [Alphaproteobacteria bacterium]